MMRSSFVIICFAALGACSAASAARPAIPSYVAAHLLAGSPPIDKDHGNPGAGAIAMSGLSRHLFSPDRAIPALAHVDAAKRRAIQEPGADRYAGAAQIYLWVEGDLYRLYTAPEEVSDIALQPGETLVSVAAGDTSRWVIGDTSSGTGAARQVHILVKPSASGLRTNLVIATDRRTYHLEMKSTASTAMSSIAWSYPQDALLALRASLAPAEQSIAAGVAIETLNFNYRIDGDRAPWRPLRAFDDGHQVFIEFPPTLADSEAPPLFVRGEGGRAELVNYRVRGRYYVVDRLFSVAELRLGERRQLVVRITREGGKSS